MDKILSYLTGFSCAVVPNKKFVSSGVLPCSIRNIEDAGFDIIPASVPGNTELDMMKAGLIDFDPFFGTNIFKMQDYENIHTIYYTRFDKPATNAALCFDGIDTISDIYINGVCVKHTDNMFIGYEIPLCGLKEKDNELVIHVKPVMIEARKYDIPVVCNSLTYGFSSLYIRKAAHMYGWDIMPRIVSSGIYKDVYIKEIKEDRIRDVYFRTLGINKEKKTASVSAYYALSLSEDKAQDYTMRIRGVCGDSSFEYSETVYATSAVTGQFTVNDVLLWWPRNAGKQNLYDITFELLYKGSVVDTYVLKTGIRTVSLSRTDTTDKDGNGDFCFIVNGERIFAMGSNWVPLDAFHSRDRERLQKSFELLYDVGSNIVRCWGGNVYESNEFYSLCDKYGIMVWQDFAMGCAVYPQEKRFYDMLEEEVVYTIKRLRNHPAIVLWAGDNEGDYAYMQWSGYKRDPDKNIVTRRVLAELCEAHDFLRPYLPSSPYITHKTMMTGDDTSEDHLWGPRDYFKGEYYKHTVCHFASETGYHACPSPESVRKFIPEEDLWPWFKENGKAKATWLAHAACMEPGEDAPFSYRIKLMSDQVVTLFGGLPDNLSDFAKQSQISQAEACKYFIERFRLSKPRRSGIIWWNIVDGWPQFSDAVVDYYFVKKLAYHYIKRSQNPVCLMFDEPDRDGFIKLYAVNDTMRDVRIKYTVRNVTDKTDVCSGEINAFSNSSAAVDRINILPDEKKFYLIEWTINGNSETYKNHYFTNIINISFEEYGKAMCECGFDEFEGF